MILRHLRARSAVRPDGHVAWAGTDGDDTALSAAVDRALATTHRPAAR